MYVVNRFFRHPIAVAVRAELCIVHSAKDRLMRSPINEEQPILEENGGRGIQIR